MAKKTDPNQLLSADSTIKEWLDHPVGGDILRGLLEANGQKPNSLAPVKSFPFRRLIKLSKGAFTLEQIEELALQANGGVAAPVSSGDDSESGSSAAAEWTEKVSGGRFEGRTIIITGAGSGIGRATASRVAREGGRVIAVDMSKVRLDEFAAEHKDFNVVPLVGNITNDADVAKIVETAGPEVSGLANIAGIMDDFTGLGDVTDATWERVFAVNVTGTMKLGRAVIPLMVANGYGSIVNIASEAGLRGSAAGVAYTASKHAVIGLTKSTAFIYGETGVRVNAVAPGGTITNIEGNFAPGIGSDRVQALLGGIPAPVEAPALAASISFLLSDDGINLNGVILPSDGGWSVQ